MVAEQPLRELPARPTRTRCIELLNGERVANLGDPHTPVLGAPWHFLYFFPDPQKQGSLRPMFG